MSTIGPMGLYVIRADGTGLRRITGGSVIDSNPAWSPDGRSIVFIRWHRHDAEMLGVEATGPPTACTSSGPTARRPTAWSDAFIDPAWSPDGKYVVTPELEASAGARPELRSGLHVLGAHRAARGHALPRLGLRHPRRTGRPADLEGRREPSRPRDRRHDARRGRRHRGRARARPPPGGQPRARHASPSSAPATSGHLPRQGRTRASARSTSSTPPGGTRRPLLPRQARRQPELVARRPVARAHALHLRDEARRDAHRRHRRRREPDPAAHERPDRPGTGLVARREDDRLRPRDAGQARRHRHAALHRARRGRPRAAAGREPAHRPPELGARRRAPRDHTRTLRRGPQPDSHWLYTIGRDGTGLRRITTGSYDDWRPAWSPDGKWIAFTRSRFPPRRSTAPEGLDLVRPDGTGLHRLTKGSFFNPAWSPDGRYVVAVRPGLPRPAASQGRLEPAHHEGARLPRRHPLPPLDRDPPRRPTTSSQPGEPNDRDRDRDRRTRCSRASGSRARPSPARWSSSAPRAT